MEECCHCGRTRKLLHQPADHHHPQYFIMSDKRMAKNNTGWIWEGIQLFSLYSTSSAGLILFNFNNAIELAFNCMSNPIQFTRLAHSLSLCHSVLLLSLSATGNWQTIICIMFQGTKYISLCEESCGCCGSVDDGGGLENLPSYASLSARIDKPLISSCSLCLCVGGLARWTPAW